MIFFSLLGRMVRWAWPLLLAGWGIVLLCTWLAAPPFEQVAVDREFAFLPADAPSRQAEDVYAREFPDDRLASTIVLVLHRADNDPGHLQRDLKFIDDVLEPRLRNIADAEGGLASEAAPSDEPLFGDEAPAAPKKPKPKSIILRIRTPNAPGSGALLVSPDGQALLVVVELTTDFLSKINWPTITKIEDLVRELRQQQQLPPGVDIAVTGSAVIGRDRNLAQLQSARATETLTVVLVIVLLILIYRAPLLAIIPLATVYVAVQLALNLLALLAQAGWFDLFQGIQIYITILAYGAGVDYCLFLTARYKEELDHGHSPADAVARAVGGVGAALTASAATVICGIAMMMFAQFGKFRQAGFAIPLSLLLVLCATLTFSPALLRLAGRWAFWPRRSLLVGGNQPAAAPGAERGWLFRAGGLQRMWERVGHVLLRRPGTVWLATVAIMAPFVVAALLLYNHLSYDLIGSLPPDAPSVAGTRTLQEHFPAGVIGPVTVVLTDPQVDFGSRRGRALVGHVTEQLRAQKEELGLADIRSLTAPMGITAAAGKAFVGIEVDPELRTEAAMRKALEHYTNALVERDRTGTRLDLILVQSPFARWSIEDLNRIEQVIRQALPAGLRKDCRLDVVGTTASVRDLATVVRGDRNRIELLVLASVLVVLIVLLRRVVVSVYLLLSVLFSYYATLGVAFAVFWLLDPQGFTGIDWKVAIFLFTILVAVGEDYNIFLLTRIDEEEREHGPIHGVTAALARTGPIISSCGIIMAGTFASLLGGSLLEMKQLGFALAFGVLLDTFVVRPILVPAFLILLGSGRLPLLRRAAKVPPTPGEAPRPRSMARSS
jgi:RND superfamily putative drug exporter